MIFQAEKSALPLMLQFVREVVDIEEEEMARVELACEEVLFNIISYASSDRVEITIDPPLTIVIRDWGRPFNLLEEAPEVDQGASLEERPVGGLGVFLVSKVIQRVDYRREEDANVLSLKIR